jgi:hypothetical protein
METNAMDHQLAIKSQACEKYLLGELPPALREAYEDHYFSCAECATQLRMAAELVGAGQMIFRATPSSPARHLAAENNKPGWLHWLRPAIAVPVFATLLLLIGYQNTVTIPHLKTSAAPQVLPTYSLIAGNTRGDSASQISIATHPGEQLGLWIEIPVAPAYSNYQLSLQTPDNRTIPLRNLPAADAQKTQIVAFAPSISGDYAIVITGTGGTLAASTAPTELARIHFTVAF